MHNDYWAILSKSTWVLLTKWHAWFQHLLATNEAKHAWMDEGLLNT